MQFANGTPTLTVIFDNIALAPQRDETFQIVKSNNNKAQYLEGI